MSKAAAKLYDLAGLWFVGLAFSAIAVLAVVGWSVQGCRKARDWLMEPVPDRLTLESAFLIFCWLLSFGGLVVGLRWLFL